LASRQGFGELKTEQLGGHSQEQQRHRQAPIDDDDDEAAQGKSQGKSYFDYMNALFPCESQRWKITSVPTKCPMLVERSTVCQRLR